MENLTHYRKLRDPNYIGAYELMPSEGETIELVVTIEGVKKEELKNAEKNQGMVLYLRGHKPMIVNSVNAKSITAALGSPFVEHWIGKQITLYVVKIKAFGEFMEALRVRKEAPAVVLPDLPVNSKTHLATVAAIKDKKTTLEDGLSFLRSKYNLSDEIIKTLEDAAI